MHPDDLSEKWMSSVQNGSSPRLKVMKTRVLLAAIILMAATTAFSQPASFYSRGIGGGGALFFPSINPANENEFYVSCDMSELFHSADFGISYSQVDFQKLQVFGTSTYEFTDDPDVAYSNFNDGNSGYPVKTVDGGVTWTQMDGYDVNTYGNVYSIKANYNNPLQLLIGAYGDILFSNNGGTSFTLVKHAAYMGAGLTMGGVFWDANNIFIGTNEGIIFSTNAGASFAVMTANGMTAGQQIWSFAGAKEGSETRFACIAANSGDVYNGVMPWDYYNFAKGVYVMDNASGTWISQSAGINFSNDFVMYAAMAQNDIHTIYLGGHDLNLGAPLVYRSVNGGSSWSKVFNTTGNANIITAWEGYNGDKNWSWSESCFGISVAPNNPDKVMFGNFSNVQVSSDGGENWRQAYVNPADQHPAGSSTPKNLAYHSIGIESTTCWQVRWQDANTLMGCFSDIGGIRSIDAGVSWGYQYTGFSVNTLYRVEKGSNGTLYGGCSNIHDIYQSTRLADAQLDANDANGKIVYSADNGATWSNLHVFNHPVFWLAPDPNDQNTLYASVIHFGGTQGAQLGGIYKTNDLNNLAGSSWTRLPNPPRTEGHPACIAVLNDGKVVCTFSGRRNPSGVFTASSGVFLYDPGLNSWTDVSNPGMYYWTKDIIIDPNDPLQNTWYVCVFSGWGGAPNGLGGLYKTSDRGANWTKLTGSQFDRVTSVTFDPQHLTHAYLTTETQGLWLSTDMNNSLPSWTLVASYPFRQPERVFFNPYNMNEMWVTSFGNGMKTGNLNATGTAEFQPADGNPIVVSPNPAKGEITLTVTGIALPSDMQIFLFDLNGKTVKRIPIRISPSKISLAGLTSGMYLYTIRSGNNDLKTGKIIIE
jgi:photosystem II stability/assembly factor-like uncharacterized protein